MRVGLFPFTNLVLRLRLQDEVPADLAVVLPRGRPTLSRWRAERASRRQGSLAHVGVDFDVVSQSFFNPNALKARIPSIDLLRSCTAHRKHFCVCARAVPGFIEWEQETKARISEGLRIARGEFDARSSQSGAIRLSKSVMVGGG